MGKIFLGALCVTLRRMHCVDHLFISQIHKPNPKQPSQGTHLRRKQDISMCYTENKKSKSKSKNKFQYGFKIPKD